MTRLALVLLAGIYVAGCASAPRSVVIRAELLRVTVAF
jgi:hypothetical protein